MALIAVLWSALNGNGSQCTIFIRCIKSEGQASVFGFKVSFVVPSLVKLCIFFVVHVRLVFWILLLLLCGQCHIRYYGTTASEAQDQPEQLNNLIE